MSETRYVLPRRYLTPRWWRRLVYAARSGWGAAVGMWQWLGENEPLTWHPAITTTVTGTLYEPPTPHPEDR